MVNPVLEPAAQAFGEANANPPFLFDLGPVEGRKVLDEVQNPEIEVPGTVKEPLTTPVGPTGTVSLTVFKPVGSASPPPVIFYIHGAG
jgi:acetyl esterase